MEFLKLEKVKQISKDAGLGALKGVGDAILSGNFSIGGATGVVKAAIQGGVKSRLATYSGNDEDDEE